MNRRNFIRYTGLLAPAIVAFNPLSARQTAFLQKFASDKGNANRVLVLIQLNGGNDGLNTIIPLKSYNVLSEVRKNILIPESQVLKLNSSNSYGIHPSMPGLQQLYNNKMVSVIHGVGYPNPDLSHFKGINIKLTANCNPDSSRSGWVGRYLEQAYPDYGKNKNITVTDGPPGMRIGEVSPIISQGTNVDLGIGVNSIDDLNFSGPDISKDPLSNNMGGTTIGLIRDISKQVEMYAPIIKSASEKQPNLSKLYPEEHKNQLADQLKIVARLIGGNLNSRVYVVNQMGYDTHANQVDKADPTKGAHADLLHNLSEAITAFEDDLHLMGKQDEVLGMTFSEFGRRIKSSDSYGTDHGTAETVILFGTKLKAGMIEAQPETPLQLTDENLPVFFDFRSVYASVLKGWFGLPEEKLKNIIQQGPAERLDLFTV